jgi:hypothetical protein
MLLVSTSRLVEENGVEVFVPSLRSSLVLFSLDVRFQFLSGGKTYLYPVKFSYAILPSKDKVSGDNYIASKGIYEIAIAVLTRRESLRKFLRGLFHKTMFL